MNMNIIKLILINILFITSLYANKQEKELLQTYEKLQKSLQPVINEYSKLPILYKQKLSEEIIKFAASLNKKNSIILVYNKNTKLTVLPYQTYYFSLSKNSPINYKKTLDAIRNKVIEEYKNRYQNYYSQYIEEMETEIAKRQKEFIKTYKITQIYFYPYKNIVVFVKLYNNTYSTLYLNKNQNKISLQDILKNQFKPFNIIVK